MARHALSETDLSKSELCLTHRRERASQSTWAEPCHFTAEPPARAIAIISGNSKTDRRLSAQTQTSTMLREINGTKATNARPRPRRTRVMLAAEGLLGDIAAALMTDFDDIELLPASVADGELVEHVRRQQPDVVLLGRHFGGVSAVDLTDQLHTAIPSLCILGIDFQLDEALVRDMLRLGASGYLVADSKPADLQMALRCGAEGRVYLCPSVAEWMVEQYIRPAANGENGNGAQRRATDARPNAEMLTERERQIIRLLADGLSNKRIAEKLDVCVQTISAQRRKLMEKLQVNSIAALTKFAIAEGITSVDQMTAPDVLARI